MGANIGGAFWDAFGSSGPSGSLGASGPTRHQQPTFYVLSVTVWVALYLNVMCFRNNMLALLESAFVKVLVFCEPAPMILAGN